MGDSRQLPENWELLPPEVIAEICKKLSAKGLVALKNTAKGFTRFFERYFRHYLRQPEAFAGLIESSAIPELKDFFTEFFPDAQEIMANPDILLNVLNQLSRKNICKLIRCADLDGTKLQADASSEAKEMAHIACFALTTINIRSLDQAKLARAIEYYSRPENSRYRNIRRSLEAIQAILQLNEPLQLTKALIPVDCYLNISGIQNIDPQTDLSSMDFSFVNARHVVFVSNLSHALFIGALLNKAQFLRCKLMSADFTDACADEAKIGMGARINHVNAEGAIFTGASLIGAELRGSFEKVTLTDAVFFDRLDSAAKQLSSLRLRDLEFKKAIVKAIVADFVKKIPRWQSQINPMMVSTCVIEIVRLLMGYCSEESLLLIKDKIFHDNEWIDFIQKNHESLEYIISLLTATMLAFEFSRLDFELFKYHDPTMLDSFFQAVVNLNLLFRSLSDEVQVKQLKRGSLPYFMDNLNTVTSYIGSMLVGLQHLKKIESENYAVKGQPFTPDVEKRLKTVNHAINLLDQAKSAVMQTGDFAKMAEAFKYLSESQSILQSIHPKEKIEPKESLLSQVGKLFEGSPKSSTDVEHKPKRPDKKS